MRRARAGRRATPRVADVCDRGRRPHGRGAGGRVSPYQSGGVRCHAGGVSRRSAEIPLCIPFSRRTQTSEFKSLRLPATTSGRRFCHSSRTCSYRHLQMTAEYRSDKSFRYDNRSFTEPIRNSAYGTRMNAGDLVRRASRPGELKFKVRFGAPAHRATIPRLACPWLPALAPLEERLKSAPRSRLSPCPIAIAEGKKIGRDIGGNSGHAYERPMQTSIARCAGEGRGSVSEIPTLFNRIVILPRGDIWYIMANYRHLNSVRAQLV